MGYELREAHPDIMPYPSSPMPFSYGIMEK